MNTLAIEAGRRRRTAAAKTTAPRSVTDIVKPSIFELSALAGLLLFTAGGYRLGGAAIATTNVIVPTALMIVLGLSALLATRQDMAALWMPLTWARVSLISYYGAGSLVPFFANEDTVQLLESFYAYFPADVAKYNFICVTFTFIFFLSARVICGVTERLRFTGDQREWRPSRSGLDSRSIGLVFLIPGMAISFLYIKPHSFGMIEGTLPQVLSQLSLLTNVGYYILTRWALKERPVFVWLIVALIAIEFLTGLLELAKTAALFPLVVFAIAFIQHRPTINRIVISAVSVFFLYAAISPVITYGRTVLANRYGSILVASPAERWDIVTSYTPDRAAELSDSTVQLAWARLSYVNAATFAINQYDLGQPGNSLRYAAVALIPRFIYPSKPNMTAVGSDFNIAVNGNATSQSSPGIPAELYWNGGLLAVVLGSLYIGLVLTGLSFYAVAVVRAEAWYLLPVVILGMRIGVRMDGFVVPDFIGPLPVLVVAHIALTFLNNLTLKKK